MFFNPSFKRKIKMKIIMLILVIVLTTTNTFAANTLTPNVKITKIDAVSYNGDIRVQTAPRPNITGLACTSDFWLVIRAGTASYDVLVSLALAAKFDGTNISVGADDTNLTGGFCELSRLVLD